mgnify:CR=1 FL=1
MCSLKITYENLPSMMELLRNLNVRPIRTIGSVTILTTVGTPERRLYVIGKVKCPYCREHIDLYVVKHDTVSGPRIVQCDGEFKTHMETKHPEFSKEWIACRVESYSRSSFHKVTRYYCQRCGYRSRRYADTLIHIIQEHGFGT